MSEQDHARTLREMAVELQRRNYDDDAELEALEAGAAALSRTCGTCRYHVDGWQCNETGPTYLHETPTDFGCTLHQPQEPSR
jgi:hypothetical protein